MDKIFYCHNCHNYKTRCWRKFVTVVTDKTYQKLMYLTA